MREKGARFLMSSAWMPRALASLVSSALVSLASSALASKRGVRV